MAPGASAKLSGYRSPGGEITIPLPGSTLEVMPEGAEPVQFEGLGKIVTYTIVYVPTKRFRDQAPYTLAVVELDEGGRLLALIDGGVSDNLSVGRRVAYKFKDEYGYHFVPEVNDRP